jgi:hypothetical protein
MSAMWLAPERRSRRRWLVPTVALLTGVALAVVLTTRDEVKTGLVVLAVLAGYAGILAYRRHEPALALSGAFGSGHRARGHLKAAAMTGDILSLALVGATITQSLRGADITPYAWLAALAGATYALSVLVSGDG